MQTETIPKRLRLSPIVVPKTSDVLASELRRQILTGVLPPGVSLPAERDLVAQTGLSRGSVRDALRILESESLVITRPGRYGGSVANKPDDESLKRSISSFVPSTPNPSVTARRPVATNKVEQVVLPSFPLLSV